MTVYNNATGKLNRTPGATDAIAVTPADHSGSYSATIGDVKDAGFTPEDVANKSTNTSLGTSDTAYPSQKATKTYVDAQVAALRLKTAHAKYSFAVDGGAQGEIIPATSDSIPENAIIVGGVINSTTAVTSNGSATVAAGTHAGSAANSILAATAKAALGADVLTPVVPTFAVPVKMTAAGQISITVGAADLIGGIIEIWLFYVTAAA